MQLTLRTVMMMMMMMMTMTPAHVNVAAVIITGGWQTAGTSAEVFLPASLATCQLPALPRPRYQHSQDGALLCSGTTGAGFEAGVEMACVELTVEGIWATTHTLLMPRSQVGDT